MLLSLFYNKNKPHEGVHCSLFITSKQVLGTFLPKNTLTVPIAYLSLKSFYHNKLQHCVFKDEHLHVEKQ